MSNERKKAPWFSRLWRARRPDKRSLEVTPDLSRPTLQRREHKLPITTTEAENKFYSDQAVLNWSRQFGLLTEEEIRGILDTHKHLLDRRVLENIGPILENRFRAACREKGGVVNGKGKWTTPD